MKVNLTFFVENIARKKFWHDFVINDKRRSTPSSSLNGKYDTEQNASAHTKNNGVLVFIHLSQL